MYYRVVLKNLNATEQVIVLHACESKAIAEERRKMWRKALGDKRWTVDRRPGLDTLDNLALTVEEVR